MDYRLFLSMYVCGKMNFMQSIFCANACYLPSVSLNGAVFGDISLVLKDSEDC